MEKLITQNIEVSVEAKYIESASAPKKERYVYAYNIVISNKGAFPVKLTGRSWFVADSNGEQLHIEGIGVVGETPTIAPGEHYEYQSSVHLKTGIGSMEGFYNMINILEQKEFDVKIPKFQLLAPFVLN